jgi:nitroreductase
MNVLDAIRNRRSVREYDPRDIPEDVLERMKEVPRLAPSACNNQPWKFVLVRDAALRSEIAKACGRQGFVAGAPVIVVGVGFPEAAYRRMGGNGNSVEVDLAIALDHLTLAAAAEGMGSCWIGAFDEKKVGELIHAPQGARIVALLLLGYPARPNLLGPAPADRRKPAGEIFLADRFG